MFYKDENKNPEKKVKKKKDVSQPLTGQDYSEKINNEVRKEEKDDETSESDDDETSTSDDSDAELKENARQEIVVKELDFGLKEPLFFSGDVYSYTICANMTKCCSPLQQGFALKQCFIVFSVQLAVPLYFLGASSDDEYAVPDHSANLIRLICCVLLHMIIYQEVRTALRMLRYLKYVKTAKGGKRGRMINILLSLMQLTSPIVAEIVLILAIAKTPQLQMIIKSFVALGFVINIDNMFSDAFPSEIKKTADSL